MVQREVDGSGRVRHQGVHARAAPSRLRATVFAPFFAEETLVNLAVQDTYCPLSKEPDFKKTCVSIEKLEG